MEVEMVKARNGSSRSHKASPSSPRAASRSTPPPKLVTATIDAFTGRIIDVRSADDAGLSVHNGGATLEDLFEQAFEAGIACVLGEDGNSEADESKEDAALRRQILRPMIQHSAARRLMRQDVLGRAIVGTLIQKAGAASSRPSPSA
jgi:hypothetical protein